MCERPVDYDSTENLIALSEKAFEAYLLNPTTDEFKRLLEAKKFLPTKYNARKAIDRMELEDDIRITLAVLMDSERSGELVELKYEVLQIDEKIKDNPLLKNEIQYLVLQYYRFIEKTFNDSQAYFDTIAAEVKVSSLKLERYGISKEDVVESLAEWIHKKSKLGDRGKTACRILVVFFIQNCEVFSREISK